MPSLNIRNVPTELLAKLKSDAALNGQTLRQYVLMQLGAKAEEEPAVPAKKIPEASDDLVSIAVARHTGHTVGHDCAECQRARKLLSK